VLWVTGDVLTLPSEGTDENAFETGYRIVRIEPAVP
jgi:hypothetical protein